MLLMLGVPVLRASEPGRARLEPSRPGVEPRTVPAAAVQQQPRSAPAQTARPPLRVASQPAAAQSATAASPEVGVGTKLLWYLPNRVIDLIDIFRLRVKVGPGLSAGLRVTDYGSFYAGEHHTVYAGLPGPRAPRHIRLPYGRESLKGIVIAGVDATDETAHGPEYGWTEVDVGAHLLLVGAEAGIDPFEIGDFLAGFLTIDLGGDDYPRVPGPVPEMTSAVSIGAGEGMFRVDPKPPAFDTIYDRLDYLHTNVQTRVSRPVEATDRYLAADGKPVEPVPPTRLRLGTYVEGVQGEGTEISFEPDVDIEVAVPNLERRMRVFVQSATADDLPGRTRAESDDEGITVGARRFFEGTDIATDAGIRARWPLEAYARVSWKPRYTYEKWSFRPEQRFFYETDDRLGELSVLRVDRWLGDTKEFYIGDVMSAKWTQESDTFEWEQTIRWGHVRELIDENDKLLRYAREDIASGGDVAFSVFGSEGVVDTYRLTVGIRRPLYQRWIFWEVEPGLEWKDEEDFDTAYRLTVGIDMLFWGPGYQ